MSLSNLGAGLFKAGRLREAEAPMCEAVETSRELANERPTVYNRDYAFCLFNMAFGWPKVECGEAALSMIQESVKIYYDLARDHPAVYNYELVSALDCLGDCLADIGDKDDAVAAWKEAILLLVQGANHGNNAPRSQIIQGSLTPDREATSLLSTPVDTTHVSSEVDLCKIRVDNTPHSSIAKT